MIGGLTTPSEEFQEMGRAMETMFVEHQGNSGFKFKRNVVETLVAAILKKYPSFDTVVIKKYIKIRTIVRMRYENLKAEGLLVFSLGSSEDTVSEKGRKASKHHIGNEGCSGPAKRIKLNNTKKPSINKSHLIKKYKKLSSK